MTISPYEGATPQQLSSPLVREFLAVHDMFRTELATMLRFIDQLMNGEAPLDSPEAQYRIRSVIQAGSRYTYMLHMHHTIETSTMFPALAIEGLEPSIVQRLNSDHDEIGVLIDGFSEAIHRLATIEPDVLNHDLRRLADALHNHLAYEETHVCPLLARWTHWPPTH
jgi:hemerythrin-like domain-containing protein